jgi:hypothetical protein
VQGPTELTYTLVCVNIGVEVTHGDEPGNR